MKLTRKHFVGGMIVSIIMIAYGAVQSFGAEPLSSDLITRFELDHYADNQESQRIDMLNTALKSTVRIRTSSNGKNGSGSGVFISPSTLITNKHVIDKADSISIKTIAGTVCNVLGTTKYSNKDIATIQTDCHMPYLKADYAQKVGQDIYALGSPGELEFSAFKGIVNAVRQTGGEKWVQFDAFINFGSSGGPLINSKGEVIAIVSNKSELDHWVGLAIPIDKVKNDIDLALEKEVPHGSNDTGPNHS